MEVPLCGIMANYKQAELQPEAAEGLSRVVYSIK